ncbi:MAG: DHH family phosphoesterase [Candidatus Eisenbacteria bacterium]
MQTKPLAERIRDARQIILTTHQGPDGDGIGSQLGIAFALEALGVRAEGFLQGEVPARLRFLPGAHRLRDWDQVAPAERHALFAQTDFALVLDTHAWDLAGSLGEQLRTASFPTFFLDHHPSPACRQPQVFCDPYASSTGELCWSLIRELGAPLSPEAATCLYAAIAYDTNSFKYLRGRATAHHAAAALIEAGADAATVYRHLFASRSPRKIALFAQILDQTRREDEGRIAWLFIPRAWAASDEITRDDLRDLVTCLLETEGVEVAFTLQEETSDTLKVSLRSMGRVPVNRVARQLGGGGHMNAAAAQIPGPIERAAQQVLSLIRAAESLPEYP